MVNLNKYIKEIETGGYSNDNFKLTRVRKNFVIENIGEDANPDETLKQCIQYSIDQTIEKSRKQEMEADQIGITISSVLLDYDIYTPIRPINANTTDTVLNMFLKVSQSKGRDGSLLGEPFTITVTGVRVADLPKTRAIIGSGSLKNSKKLVYTKKINKAFIINADNTDRYCLFYALEIMRIYSSKEMTPMQFSRYKRNNGKRRQDVMMFLSKANIPTDLMSYDATIWCPVVQKYYDRVYGPDLFKIFIFRKNCLEPIYRSDAKAFQFPILLYHNNNHFDGIRTISKFLNCKNYCLSCESSYDSGCRHKSYCKARCRNCSGIGPEFPCKTYSNFKRKCALCKKTFSNYSCYKNHITNNYCLKARYCELCGLICNREGDSNVRHICGEKYCPICRHAHKKDECYIFQYKPKPYKPYRIIAYDFESEQKFVNDSNQRIHNVNFVCAKVFCTECISTNLCTSSLEKPCDICGQFRTLTWSPFEFRKTIVDKHNLSEDPLADFTKWILYEQNNRYPTYAFAHFGGRYDCTLIFGEIIRNGICPDIIRQGNRLYEMKIDKTSKTTKTFFRDSFNYVSQKLDSLVKAFDLPVQTKMWFPHMFNRSENYNKKFPKLPPKDDYLYKSKKPNEKESFEKWYSEHQNDNFDFNEVLAEYCVNDVEILSLALVALRDTFLKVTRREGKHGGIDILKEAITIASACMKTFRLNHLNPKHLAVVPENSYEKKPNQSLLALKFLAWYSHTNSIDLRTSLSENAEKRFGRYLLDGYNEEQKLAVEFHGCYYHACQKCFPDDQVQLMDNKTAGFLREKNEERREYLEKCVNKLEVYYECEVKNMLKEDPKMKKFFENYVDNGPIKLRDAFFGGRTGPMKIYHQVKEGEKISYKDVRSLYPKTNFSTEYPVGHPEKKIFKYFEQTVNWTHPSHNPYRGILKVLLIPPKNLRVPVMPSRIGNDDLRLLFTLCHCCAKKYPEGGRIKDYTCKHSEAQRQFVSTCTHIELNEALNVGYKVKKLFRVLEYKSFDDTIFKKYVREFFKIKLEASGFEKEFNTEEKQDIFLKECLELFGVEVEKGNMIYNAALRTLAKICLNSLWGRFALRNLLSKTLITNDPFDLYVYFNDPKIELSCLDQISENMFLITYKTKEEFIEEHDSSNIVLSLWTTSAARIALLKLLQKVDATPGCEILYMDTDSVIYSHPENSDPLSTGPHLGDLTDECDGKKIVEYVSAGCKNYAMKIEKANGEFEYMLKIRGITLDYNTCQILNYETFKSKVLNYGSDNVPITVKYDNFLRPNIKKGLVYTVPMKKVYRPVICKGIVNEKYEVVNFGTCTD